MLLLSEAALHRSEAVAACKATQEAAQAASAVKLLLLVGAAAPLAAEPVQAQ